jgi:hypothetical protein
MLCPEIGGRLDRHKLEIDQIVPVLRPAAQQFQACRFHELEAASVAGVHPACVIGDSRGEHPAIALEALTDLRDASGLEMFDYHEEHTRQSTPAWKWAKQRAPGTAHAQEILKRILFSTFKARMLLKTNIGEQTVRPTIQESESRSCPIGNLQAQVGNRNWPADN